MKLFRERIPYSQLNSRQKENYNFQKVAAVLAEYGYVCLRLTDDWQGADFIAQDIYGGFIPVQLKGRLTFAKHYMGKQLHIAFRDSNGTYLYPHDELLEVIFRETNVENTASWESGNYNFPYLSEKLKPLLEPYRLQAVDQ